MNKGTEWTTQVRRGILEYCVLSLIQERPRYGYDLITTLSQWEPLAITEGTLYPLTRRLQKEGQIEAFWEESAMGPPRKFYRLTADGQALVEAMEEEWATIVAAVTALRSSREEP